MHEASTALIPDSKEGAFFGRDDIRALFAARIHQAANEGNIKGGLNWYVDPDNATPHVCLIGATVRHLDQAHQPYPVSGIFQKEYGIPGEVMYSIEAVFEWLWNYDQKRAIAFAHDVADAIPAGVDTASCLQGFVETLSAHEYWEDASNTLREELADAGRQSQSAGDDLVEPIVAGVLDALGGGWWSEHREGQ